MFCKIYIFNLWVFMQANPGTMLSRYLGDSRTVFRHWSCSLKMVQCVIFSVQSTMILNLCSEMRLIVRLKIVGMSPHSPIIKVVTPFQSYMATPDGILGTHILTSLHATFQLLNTVVASTNLQIVILNNTLTRKGPTQDSPN